MSAKTTLRRNKTNLQTALSGEFMFILNKVQEKELITDREYNNLKNSNKDEEGQIVDLVDKIMKKGEKRCQGFLSLLQTDEELKATFPELRLNDIQLNDTSLLPTPVQATPVVDSDVLPQGSIIRDEKEYYILDHNPRGLCVVINNEEFPGTGLSRRRGTQEDAKALRTVFTRLGFTVVVHNNLTAANIQLELQKLGSRDFMDEDALVVCVLSHGEKDCVLGTDEQQVFLRELTQPFSSEQAPTLAGKPKLFFIQACQGSDYQRGSMPPPLRASGDRQSLEDDGGLVRCETVRCETVPWFFIQACQGSDYQRGSVPCPPMPELEEGDRQSRLEEDAGRGRGGTVPWAADFLLGMATMPGCRSFRNTYTGSIYIQELCMQLTRSAESSEMDDILTVLTRVNREVSRGDYLRHKQMPEPKYTLTKKLVLRFVS